MKGAGARLKFKEVMGTKGRKWMIKGGLICKIVFIHLCELDTLKLFLRVRFDGSGTSFEDSNCHCLVGRRPGETEMLHIWKAKPWMRLRHKRVVEYRGERVSEGWSEECVHDNFLTETGTV